MSIACRESQDENSHPIDYKVTDTATKSYLCKKHLLWVFINTQLHTIASFQSHFML